MSIFSFQIGGTFLVSATLKIIMKCYVDLCQFQKGLGDFENL